MADIPYLAVKRANVALRNPFHLEEGYFENDEWIFERVWNGDQTDWGLNFTSKQHVLKVTMAAYTP